MRPLKARHSEIQMPCCQPKVGAELSHWKLIIGSFHRQVVGESITFTAAAGTANIAMVSERLARRQEALTASRPPSTPKTGAISEAGLQLSAAVLTHRMELQKNEVSYNYPRSSPIFAGMRVRRLSSAFTQHVCRSPQIPNYPLPEIQHY